ncbi:MAG: plastocyanin/azurin family copper-binding protein [Chlorobiaceae bacterium]
MNRTIKFFKTGFLTASMSLITSNAFSSGIFSGTIDTDITKNKENAVVYLKDVKGVVVTQKAVVDMNKMSFTPKVTAIPVGSTVTFNSYEKLEHNIYSISAAKKFRLNTYNTGVSTSIVFDKPGVVQLLCSCHPDMLAWVIVGKNQYAAVTDHDGKFSIPNVPAGTYEIGLWSRQLSLKEKTTVTVTDGETAPVVLKTIN